MKLILTLAFILIISAAISLPLSKSGLYTMHDDQQVARLFLFHKALFAGQFPPRWVDELGFGFGYPLFVFYPPLVYGLGEIIHLLSISFISSIKAVFFLSFFLSGVAMFVLGRYLYGPLAGVVGSTFYLLAPYRAIDVYVRGALAEAFSFVWTPLIIWSFLKLQKKPSSLNVILSAIFLALLMLTHNLILLPFSFLLTFFLAFLFFTSNKKKVFIISALLSIALGAGLSAFFWIPAILEKKFTIVDDLLIVNLANYKLHFVYLTQLWDWTWGFGGSTEGINDGISFKIGKLHIIASAFALLLSSIYLYSVKNLNKSEKNLWLLAPILCFLFIVAAFMTTFYSKHLWDILTPLAYLQFPWRFLTFTALFSSILASAFIFSLRLSVLKIIFSLILVVSLLLSNLKLFKPQFYRVDLTDEKATSSETLRWEVSSSSFEYAPKGVELSKNALGANMINIVEEELPTKKVNAPNYVEISEVVEKPGFISFTATTENETNIILNTFSFPGWRLEVNNKVQEFYNDNKFRIISFKINEGVNKVQLKFTNTKTRSISNTISLLSFLAIIVYLINIWRTSARK